jgi:hypothetical protein
MLGQKCLEIALGDPDDAIDAVHNQIAFRDPAPNGARRNIESFGHRFDGVVTRETISAATATTGMAGKGRSFARGLSSESHGGPRLLYTSLYFE